MGFIVSDLTLKDKEAWEALYQQYADFYQVPMECQTLERVWGWTHDKGEAFYCIVARNSYQQPIGFMHFRAMHSPLRGSKVGFLDDLFVAPECRESGVVEKLFEALDAKAQKHGWPFVRWITADDNLRAQAAYHKISNRTPWVTYQLDAGRLTETL